MAGVTHSNAANNAGKLFILDGTPDYWLPIVPAIGVLWEF